MILFLFNRINFPTEDKTENVNKSNWINTCHGSLSWFLLTSSVIFFLSNLILLLSSLHWVRTTDTFSPQEPSQGWLLAPSLPCAWNGPLSVKDLLSPILQS